MELAEKDGIEKGSPIRNGSETEGLLKAIRRIMHAVDSRSKQVARITGLTIPQIVVLRAIRDLGEVPTNRLSAHVDLTPATVITILDKLDAKGLAERRRSTDDRRIVYTRLTDKGREIVSEAPALFNDAVINAFAGMSEGRRQRIVAALIEVADLFEVADTAPPAFAPVASRRVPSPGGVEPTPARPID